MKTTQLCIALTIANFGMLVFSLSQPRNVAAQDIAPVLRGRALEIVDDRGRVRASINVFPEDPKVKMPDGTTGYPETVLFRLITPQGRPNIKIDANEQGAAVMAGGGSNPIYALMKSDRTNASLKLINKKGEQQLVKP